MVDRRMITDAAAIADAEREERLLRLVSAAGLILVPALTLFVHLLLIYRH